MPSEFDTHDAHWRSQLADQPRLTRELEAVLCPQPLPKSLESQILNHFRHARSPARAPSFIRTVASLAAAAMIMMMITHANRLQSSDVRLGHTVQLSASDADVIIGALATIRWNAGREETFDALDQRLEILQEAVHLQQARENGLPWSADDDWDKPVDQGTSRGAAPLEQWAALDEPTLKQRS